MKTHRLSARTTGAKNRTAQPARNASRATEEIEPDMALSPAVDRDSAGEKAHRPRRLTAEPLAGRRSRKKMADRYRQVKGRDEPRGLSPRPSPPGQARWLVAPR